MNWIDLLLAAVIILSMIAGWYRGFIIGTIALLSWTGSLVLGYLFYSHLAHLLDHFFDMGAWLLPVSFLATCLIARLLIGLVARYAVRAVPDSTNQSLVNHLLGLIPGAINGWLYSILISALLLALPMRNGFTRATHDSSLANRFANNAEWANRKLAPVFDDAVRQTINSLTVKPGSDESVDLTFTYDEGQPEPAIEAEMVKLVNQERAKAGLKPLVEDPELVAVARTHSQDMLARGYFAHVTPEGKDPFQRMKDANVRFKTAGENLALAQTVSIAHKNLMNSPGHRANIMNPSFGRIGIGVIDGGIHGIMISQEFRD